MGILPSRDSPDLFNRIKIWRIRRQLDKHYGIPDVLILRQRFLLNKTHCLLVPGSVIHHQSILLSNGSRMLIDECADGINGRGVIEHLRLRSKEDSALRNNESTIGCLETARKGLNRRGTALLIPARSNCGLDLKMNFILIYKDQRFVRFYLVSFFLKAFRSSVSSYPLLG